jgi:hypothetical protein
MPWCVGLLAMVMPISRWINRPAISSTALMAEFAEVTPALLPSVTTKSRISAADRRGLILAAGGPLSGQTSRDFSSLLVSGR